MNNTIVISNREPQQISIGGGGQVIGISKVLVNGIDVTEGSVAYVVVPTKTSELINDSGFINHEVDPTVPYYVKQISQANINNWNSKQEALVSGVNIKTINDNNILGSGNIDISTSYTAGTGIEITEENVINNTITSYDDLTDLPNIPTKTSDLLNDSGYIIADQLADVAFSGDYMDLNNTPTIPTATSDLLNDSGYITKEVNDLENYFNYDYLYNYVLPKVSDSDTNVNLSGTMPDLPLNITLSPSTLEQETTTGKNKLPNTSSTTASSGINTTANSDGSVTINGTATGSWAIVGNDYVTVETIPAGTYTFSMQTATTFDIRLDLTYTDDTTQNTFTITAGNLSRTITTTKDIKSIRIEISSGLVTGTTYNQKLYLQLESGSSATSFEKYTGGTPAPNPSYPQDIHTISGSNTIKIEGSELYNETTNPLENRSTTRVGTSGYISLIAGTYTISYSGANQVYAIYYDSNNTKVGETNWTTGDMTFTFNQDYKYVFVFRKTGDTTINVSDLSNVMLNYGSTALPYTPYVSQEADIDLDTLEYCKIGNYSDRLFKNINSDPDYDSEKTEGAWYIKKNISKVVINGTETGWGESYGNPRIPISDILGGATADLITCMSDYFLGIKYEERNDYTNPVITQENLSTYVQFRNTGQTLADFQTWLGTHNTTVYYVVATPTYTQITGTLAEQLEEVYNNLKSYNEQTNISQINNDLPFVVNATTLKSLINV